MGFIFEALSSIAGWLTIVVQALSAATALYVLCDLAEEYSSTMRRFLQYGMMVIITLYLLLLLDGLPYEKVLFGIVAHLTLLPMLRTFPIVHPFSFWSILSVVASIANHIMWFHWMLVQYPPISVQRCFGFIFVFVWMIPLGFFVSLSTPDEMLPSNNYVGNSVGNPMYNGAFTNHKKQKSNIIKRSLDYTMQQLFPNRGKRNQ